MKKIMKRLLLLLMVFLTVAIIVFFLQNQNTKDTTVIMGQATLPVVYMTYEGIELNRLHGYVDEMEVSFMRDSLTPLEESRKLDIRIRDYGSNIKGISYEVRSIDGTRLIEKTQVSQWEKQEDYIKASLNIENLLEIGTEYSLIIKISIENREEISYYTRIVLGVSDLDEKIDFIKEFSDKTFDKEVAEELVPYLESSSKGDNTNFGKVNIYSSFSQITWGELAPEKIEKETIKILNVNADIIQAELKYKVKFENMYGTDEVYNITEFFRIRYSPTRKYLLNYERTMEQIFEPLSENISGKRINLGISEDIKIDMKSSPDGKIINFIKERELWSFHVDEKKITCVFSFEDQKDDGIRDNLDEHEVKLIRTDELGNIDFIVYGYMNRGAHEGKVGITLYHYSSESKTVVEAMFIPYEKSFGILQETLGELFYINSNDNLFFILDGTIYSVDLASKEYMTLAYGLSRDSYVMNEKGNMIAWQVENEPYESETVKVLQLEPNTEHTISVNDDEKIRVIGFIEEDFIYGIAKDKNILRGINGSVDFYMSALYILDKDNKIAGHYEKEGIYFDSAEIKENMIILKRSQRNVETGEFVEIEEDYITNNVAMEEELISASMIATELKKKETGINLSVATGDKKLVIDYTKEVIIEEEKKLIIKQRENKENHYFVYAKGEMMGIFNNPSKAIALADDQVGVVLDEKGRYVWMRGNDNSRMYLSNVSVIPQEDTIAASLDGMLLYGGAAVSSKELIEKGKTIIEIINENLENRGIDLTGSTLNQILYYVNKGRPVMGRMGTEYVLIVGYDSYNVTILNPLSGETIKLGLKDSAELFDNAGNSFISYVE
ncbi:MAG: hypothetical protein GX913_06980 [Clostridiales bacterium]|nr:hypothetical protein [Clostridiales bacterium]